MHEKDKTHEKNKKNTKPILEADFNSSEFKEFMNNFLKSPFGNVLNDLIQKIKIKTLEKDLNTLIRKYSPEELMELSLYLEKHIGEKIHPEYVKQCRKFFIDFQDVPEKDQEAWTERAIIEQEKLFNEVIKPKLEKERAEKEAKEKEREANAIRQTT